MYDFVAFLRLKLSTKLLRCTLLLRDCQRKITFLSVIFLDHVLFIKSADTLFKKSLKENISSYVGIFHPPGEPISPYLLRYNARAVDDHVITSNLLVNDNFK